MATGRPTKLTPEIQERIVEALQAGNYQETACEYAGISAGTFYRWMAEGNEDDAPVMLREFREAVIKARARAEVRNVALIQNAANAGTWQASAWWLERSFPNRWGRHTKITQEVSGPEGGPIEVTDPRSVLLGLMNSALVEDAE